ncbi:MAG: CDP-archaeol synthase [Chloroflexi bacterium]|nr:CDP-archaeol synthase [Chloroflexota bacterium]
MLGKRILSAVILIPIVVAAVWLGGYWLWVLATLAALLAGYELYRLATSQELHPNWFWGLVIVVSFLLHSPPINLRAAWLVVPIATLTTLALEVRHHNRPGSLLSWALTIAGSLFIGFPFYAILNLRVLPQGAYWIVVTMAATWLGDTTAYFIGSRYGKTPFFKDISPHKTLEGAIAGGLTSLLVVVIPLVVFMQIPWYWALAAGVGIAIGAIFGDLAESVIKRQLHRKDSGNLIPGHGGMLDRIDSLMYTVTVAYLVAHLVTHGIDYFM